MWLHLAFLTIATILTWLWTTNEGLSFYTLQLTALLILIYFVKNITRNPEPEQARSGASTKYVDATILTMVVLLLIFSTGGLSSPLFFLSYFLLFGISFLFEPTLAITYSLILIVFLGSQSGFGSPQNNFTESGSLLKLFSLLLVSPLALFFGQQFLQNLVDKNRIKIYQNKWLNNEKSLEKQETNALFWLSLNFKQTLAEIVEISANLLSQFASLSPHQRDSIKKIRENAQRLMAEGQRLKTIIDKETDES
jgi:hypothetical protein